MKILSDYVFQCFNYSNMKDKLCLSLCGHESQEDRQILAKIIKDSKGDIDTLTRAYRERFMFAAELKPESEVKKLQEKGFWVEGYITVD